MTCHSLQKDSEHTETSWLADHRALNRAGWSIFIPPCRVGRLYKQPRYPAPSVHISAWPSMCEYILMYTHIYLLRAVCVQMSVCQYSDGKVRQGPVPLLRGKYLPLPPPLIPSPTPARRTSPEDGWIGRKTSRENGPTTSPRRPRFSAKKKKKSYKENHAQSVVDFNKAYILNGLLPKYI